MTTLPTVGREQVQQALLQRGQPLLGRGACHFQQCGVENVELELTDPDYRRERQRVAVGPPQQPDHPSDELLERKRGRQRVVHAQLQGGQLGFQVAPSRQADDRRADAIGGDRDLGHDQPAIEVHIEDGDVRLPLPEQGH